MLKEVCKKKKKREKKKGKDVDTVYRRTSGELPPSLI